MSYKPVDTAIVMVVGPCIDDTDFKSLEESIAYNAAGMDISLIVEKTDGTSTVTAITLTTGGTSDWTHKDGGYYEVEITAAQNAEEGIAYLRGVCTGVLPFESPRYDIEKANIYDSLRKGTDKLQIDIAQLLGTAWLTPGVAGTPDVNAKLLGGTAQTGRDVGVSVLLSSGTGAGQLDFTSGIVKSNLTQILAHLLTQTGTQLADGFEKFFDVGTPTGTINSLPDAAPDAAGGLPKSDAGGLDLDAKLANTNEVTAARMGALTDWINGGRLDLLLDIIAADTTTDIPAKILKYIQLLARGDAAIATDNATELTAINADGGSGVGDFSNQTDSEEALRDRGDAAWITGGGGSITDILNVQVLIPNSIDLANTATVRIGLGLTNMVDDLPSTAEITPGTITIDRKAIGGTSWTNIVNVAACSELAGLIYYDEVFDSGTGYVAGDSIRIIFKSQKITVAANDYEITGTDGWVFQTYVREAMRGTDGGNTTVPDAAGIAASLHATTDGKIDTNKTELDGLQGADGKAVISSDAQDLSGTLDVNTKTATATALDLILEDSTFALAIKDAIWNAILTGATFNIANSAGRRVREIGAFAIESGTAQAGNGHSITLGTGASATDGIYNRNLLVLTDNTGAGQTRTIVDYNGTTKVCVMDRDWRVSPDATTSYQIVPDDTPLTVDHGVAQGGTSTTITIRDYASSVDDAYLCNIVTIIAGKGRGQARLVGAYDGTTKVATICGDNWVETPDTTSIYVMMPYGTTCTSCIGTSALALIKTECTDATSGIKAKTDALPSGITKNVALSDFNFYMVLSSDHVTEATGKTIAGTISKDGGVFAALTNSITEIASGMYKVDLIQAEMNADVVTLKFTETDCDQRIVTIYTS